MTGHGIGCHAGGERLPRHRHAEGYVAVVLSGGFEEAGDNGRFTARPATVIVHGLYEAHQDRFEANGAQVLNLPAISGLMPGAGSIADPDAVVRLAERDPRAAAELVREGFRPGTTHADWPDLLAGALRTDPDLALNRWASEMRLDPASVSRGFARAYGVSPKRFRLEARTRRAVLSLGNWRDSLAALAYEHGFADQAHLTRSVTALTGRSPACLRAKSVQSAGAAAH